MRVPLRTRRRDLRQMCRDIRLNRSMFMAELGCFYGESTIEFARCVGFVYAIDPWSEDYADHPDLLMAGRDFHQSMAEVEAIFDDLAKDFPNIQKRKARHQDVAPMIEDGSLDVVYIDTEHSYVATAEAIELWATKVKIGGWVSGHDYADLFPGVKVAVDEACPSLLRTWGDGNWAWRV